METKPFTLISTRLEILKQSLTFIEGCEFGLAHINNGTRLVILGNQCEIQKFGFEGSISELNSRSLLICDFNHDNAVALRNAFPWLQPKTFGLRTSAGMGDRLGLATPGHVRAIQKTGGVIAPIFAQQSIREMSRTQRTPDQVLDDATWGVFQENWQGGVGADADHLKTTEDIDQCLASGFTFFTIDPGNFVNNKTENAQPGELYEIAKVYPSQLQVSETGLLNKSFKLDGAQIDFSESVLLKAVVKYGLAIWHVKSMFEHLASNAKTPFELEVSVDETDQPTSHAEHFYIASELKRLGVKWVSLAPRYIGRFEKGVDYIGDLDKFEMDLKGHAQIAQFLGPYKLSLHSGSDKFSIYPILMAHTKGLTHLKTAGTSYLEALHTIADLDKDLIKEIYVFAREHYEIDRKSYHVSAQLNKAPLPKVVSNWANLIQQFDAREIFHVTFGSVLTEKMDNGSLRFYDRLMSLLRKNPEKYTENLEKHFIRHLQPFVK